MVFRVMFHWLKSSCILIVDAFEKNWWKIVDGKNDSSVGTQNFLIIYIFLIDGIPRYGSFLLPGLAQIDLKFDRGCQKKKFLAADNFFYNILK
jgi:hypothetical protein